MLEDSARTTAMLFVILVGALIFSNFLNYTTMPADLRGLITHWQLSPVTVMVVISLAWSIITLLVRGGQLPTLSEPL